MKDDKIKVAITSGDPNGIGLEVIMKVFSDPRMTEQLTPIIYAHPEVIKIHKKANNLEEFQYNSIQNVQEAFIRKVNVLNIWKDYKGQVNFGKTDKEAGLFAFKSLEAAVQDLATNKVDILVTAPINKESIQNPDFNFPGHTEYLSKMAGSDKVLMFLIGESIKLGIVTGHLPLKDVAQQITKEKILEKLKLMQDSLLKDFGIGKPKIAVLGLNPHAGDNGLLGNEEKDIIQPAIREAADKGQYVFGPFGADGFFGSGAFKKYDAVLAMYHDQGLGPFKALAFETGVNYTAGLPIVRTSPDHGTGFDMAGQGIANESSMRAAIFLAVDIYQNRKEYREISQNPLQKHEVGDGKDDLRE